MDKDTCTWAMFLHFSLLLGFAVPLGGLIAPIIIWQLKKDQMPEIDAHGKMALNFILSMLIYSLIAFVLTFVLIGIFVFMALAVIAVVFPIIGGIKANSGELWKYPLTLNLIK
jgi:uncharacterized Tic20 family protein